MKQNVYRNFGGLSFLIIGGAILLLHYSLDIQPKEKILLIEKQMSTMKEGMQKFDSSDIKILKEEVAALRLELQTIKGEHKMNLQSNDFLPNHVQESASGFGKKHDENTDAEERLNAYIGVLEQNLIQEETDPEWTAQMEQTFTDGFARNAIESSPVIESVDCKETICRLQLQFESEIRHEMMMALDQIIPSDNEVFVRMDNNNTAVLYVSSEESRLP